MTPDATDARNAGTPRLQKARLIIMVVVALTMVAGVIAIATQFVAPVPQAFDPDVTFEEASLQAAETDRYLLAVATFDYCFMCQKYKRSTLVDDDVTQWIRDHAETVYLVKGRDDEKLASLGISSFPTTILFRNGEPIATHQGYLSTDEFLKMVKALPEVAATDLSTPASHI